ncbi:MAG TPA: crossover junction endodeoxyribonuclease RuvC, partial [bacterium]|nr:crossover junction endodeoxyribonuclease RuvC [bacterium]
QVQHMVKTLLNLKTLPPPDGADALAVAICHLHSRNRTAYSVPRNAKLVLPHTQFASRGTK